MIEQWLILAAILPPLTLASASHLLVILIAAWFTLVRPLEKWLGTHSRYTEEEQRQYWLVLKANGRERFAWRFGVLRWSLPAFAISTPLLFIGFKPSGYEMVNVSLVSLAIWSFSGYQFGRYVWQRLPKA